LQKRPLIFSILLTEATSNGHVCVRDFCFRFASRLIHTNTYAHTLTHQLRAVVFFNCAENGSFAFTYSYTHQHSHTHTYTHPHARIHTCCTRLTSPIRAKNRRFTSSHLYTHTHTHIHTHIHTNIYTHASSFIHAHARTHTPTHTSCTRLISLIPAKNGRSTFNGRMRSLPSSSRKATWNVIWALRSVCVCVCV